MKTLFVSLDSFVIMPCKSNISSLMSILFVGLNSFVIMTCKSYINSLMFEELETANVTHTCDDD